MNVAGLMYVFFLFCAGCTYAQMTPCDNGGYSVCFSNKGDPVCQCQNGWRGETCQEKLTVCDLSYT